MLVKNDVSEIEEDYVFVRHFTEIIIIVMIVLFVRIQSIIQLR